MVNREVQSISAVDGNLVRIVLKSDPAPVDEAFEKDEQANDVAEESEPYVACDDELAIAQQTIAELQAQNAHLRLRDKQMAHVIAAFSRLRTIELEALPLYVQIQNELVALYPNQVGFIPMPFPPQ